MVCFEPVDKRDRHLTAALSVTVPASSNCCCWGSSSHTYWRFHALIDAIVTVQCLSYLP